MSIVATDVRQLEQARDLGCPREAMRAERPVDRLLAVAIASEQQLALLLVPDREREHAAQHRGRLVAVLLPEMGDDLDVGVAAEAVTARLEILAQLDVVVDLAVDGDDDGAVLVAPSAAMPRSTDR